MNKTKLHNFHFKIVHSTVNPIQMSSVVSAVKTHLLIYKMQYMGSMKKQKKCICSLWCKKVWEFLI